MTVSPAPIYRFSLEDEDNRPIGVFESNRDSGHLGDWVVMRDGRRFRIVGKRPWVAGTDAELCETWLVEPA
jgi:hypothetical protein